MMVHEREQDRRLKTITATCCLGFIVIVLIGVFFIDTDDYFQGYLMLICLFGFLGIIGHRCYRSLVIPQLDKDKLEKAGPYLQGKTVWSSEVIHAPLTRSDIKYILKLSKNEDKYGILKKGEKIEVILEIDTETINLFSDKRNLDAYLYYRIEEHERLWRLIKRTVVIGIVWFGVLYIILTPLFQHPILSILNFYGTLKVLVAIWTFLPIAYLMWRYHFASFDFSIYLNYTEFIDVLESLKVSAKTKYEKKKLQSRINNLREK
ncbi:MAG: membrane protein of unknown function [Candidatus Thorarchaeota archaeon]|nr:MAG: membrane protein of unknown function [Candidatus Thorarchaeota archaeon]